MKRTLSSSVLKGQGSASNYGEASSEPSTGVKSRLGGAGGAWKAGDLSDAGSLLQAERIQVVERIMSGRQELRIDPLQIQDVIGTDRREDWRDQGAFQKLRDSIEKNGQDTPIHVWPADPDWRPDQREPENVEGVMFQLIVGRRRHAILEALERPVRALLVPQSQRGSQEERFEALFMRFRENEERENLSAFERLASIGEMFERLREASPDGKLTATDFAKRVGVHNSVVSRGRAVFASRDEILHACKNVFDLSHRDLEKALSDLSGNSKETKARKVVPATKLTIERKFGRHLLKVTGQGHGFKAQVQGITLDQQVLDGIGDVVSEYLAKTLAD